ncbi:MAG TPA: hypothetical protein VHY79_07325 [Rhizomicrobium sp.]|nr:hypothetical protein [Rhizomicrobium sp.]
MNIYLSRSLLARADRRAADLGMSRSSFFGYAINVSLSMPAIPFGHVVPVPARAGSHEAEPGKPAQRRRKV